MYYRKKLPITSCGEQLLLYASACLDPFCNLWRAAALAKIANARQPPSSHISKPFRLTSNLVVLLKGSLKDQVSRAIGVHARMCDSLFYRMTCKPLEGQINFRVDYTPTTTLCP